MHETGLIKNLIETAKKVQVDHGHKPIVGLTVEISEFGGLDEDHLRFHYSEEIKGTSWEKVWLSVEKVPTGPDVRLISVTFKESQENN